MKIDSSIFNDTINFIFTKDNSVGLFNTVVNDVYHSIYGAKEEAEQKFVKPLNFKKNYLQNKELKILDICFGIGYNTKALIKTIIQTKYKGKVSIDILENNKNLVLISPFIKDGYFKQYPEISFILFDRLFKDLYSKDTSSNKLYSMLKSKKHIEPFYRPLIKINESTGSVYIPQQTNKAFLHNIYYHCISQRNKRVPKPLNYSKFIFNTYFDDARNTIKMLSGTYDIIFLDAFTPTKQPLLWTVEFFKELYRLADANCQLVTYSNSAAVRHAMLESGFYVGKIFDNKNRQCGTIASKNNNLILNKLNDYDLGLIFDTNAGIYYSDKNLSSSCEDIIEDHNKRKLELNLLSSSSYIKAKKWSKINE